jgi:hypothetical protein
MKFDLNRLISQVSKNFVKLDEPNLIGYMKNRRTQHVTVPAAGAEGNDQGEETIQHPPQAPTNEPAAFRTPSPKHHIRESDNSPKHHDHLNRFLFHNFVQDSHERMKSAEPCKNPKARRQSTFKKSPKVVSRRRVSVLN